MANDAKSRASVKETETQIVDIDKEAGEDSVFSSGTLEELDEQSRITTHWWRQKILSRLSLFIIVALLIVACLLIFFSEDPDSVEWGRQTATTLLGFAAGAIWKSST